MGNVSSSGRHLNIPEEELKPTLYEMDPKHQKRLKKMIIDGKLAPCYRPKEDQNDDNPEECPICLLNYPCLNRSECCKQGICTECYIQVRDKKPGTRERDSKVACPFCKKEPYVVKFCGALSESEKKKIQIEEQKTREAQIRMRNEETQRDIEREELRRSQTSDRSDDEERVTPETRERTSSNRTEPINILVPERSLSSNSPQTQPEQAVYRSEVESRERSEPSPIRSRINDVSLRDHIPNELFQPELLARDAGVDILNEYLLNKAIMSSLQEANLDDSMSSSYPVSSEDPPQQSGLWDSLSSAAEEDREGGREDSPANNAPNADSLQTDSLSTDGFSDFNSSLSAEEDFSPAFQSESVEEPCPETHRETDLWAKASSSLPSSFSSSFYQDEASSHLRPRDTNSLDTTEFTAGPSGVSEDSNLSFQEEIVVDSPLWNINTTSIETEDSPCLETPPQDHTDEESVTAERSPLAMPSLGISEAASEDSEQVDTSNPLYLSNNELLASADKMIAQSSQEYQSSLDAHHYADEESLL